MSLILLQIIRHKQIPLEKYQLLNFLGAASTKIIIKKIRGIQELFTDCLNENRINEYGYLSSEERQNIVAPVGVEDDESSDEMKERAKKMLRSEGIVIGSEYRPNDPGCHGDNRAIDIPGDQVPIGDEPKMSRKVRSILGIR